MEEEESSAAVEGDDLWSLQSRLDFGLACFSIAASALPPMAKWAWCLVGAPADPHEGLHRASKVRASASFRSPLASVVLHHTTAPLHDYDCPINYLDEGITSMHGMGRRLPLPLHPRILRSLHQKPLFYLASPHDSSQPPFQEELCE